MPFAGPKNLHFLLLHTPPVVTRTKIGKLRCVLALLVELTESSKRMHSCVPDDKFLNTFTLILPHALRHNILGGGSYGKFNLIGIERLHKVSTPASLVPNLH